MRGRRQGAVAIVDALGVDVSIRGRPRPRREEPLAR